MTSFQITIFIALAMLVSTASAVCADPLAPHTITVTGDAEVLVVPDHANIDIGAVTSSSTVAAALQKNNVLVTHVVTALRSLGIRDSDIQTSTFSVSAQYRKDKNGEDDNSHVIGYAVTNKLSVSTGELPKIAKIIDAAVAVGANSSNSVEFEVKNRSKYEDQVQQTAMHTARHRAEILAKAEGAQVGQMIAVTNLPINFEISGNHQFSGLPDVLVGQATNTPVLPGSMPINAQVTVVYALK